MKIENFTEKEKENKSTKINILKDKVDKKNKENFNEKETNTTKFKNQTENLNNKTFRNVGIQTIIQTKEYISPKVAIQHNLESVEYPKLFAIPHNITAIVVVCSILIYLIQDTTNIFSENIKLAITASGILFCTFGAIYLPDSILRRPHPIIWRLLMSFGLLYMIFILFVLFQSRENVRNYLSFFDPILNKYIREDNSNLKCGIFKNDYPFIDLTNFLNGLDMYLSAHFFGWYVKMLIVRDINLCWFLSILFEIMELTFKHWLPNFTECWWDTIILDVFGMNALGIYFGDLTCKYFEFKTYKWIKDNQNNNQNNDNNSLINLINDNIDKKHNNNNKNDTKNKNKELLNKINFLKEKSMGFFGYFLPNYFIKHDWQIFSSLKRFYSFFWFITFMNLVDLSHFFMKHVLLIPQTHWLLFIRINFWALLAVITTGEYYEYITNKYCRRLGPFNWLAHTILFIEWCIVYKFCNDDFKKPFPEMVLLFWFSVFIIVSAISINLLFKDIQKFFKLNKGVNSNIYNDFDNDANINNYDPNIEIEEFNYFE
jgi:phosphatidylserine synthase 2